MNLCIMQNKDIYIFEPIIMKLLNYHETIIGLFFQMQFQKSSKCDKI